MSSQSKENLIIALATILASSQVDTERVNEALRLICDGFHFDCGRVYEIDQNNHLNLKERYIPFGMPVWESFCLEEIQSPDNATIGHLPVFYINKNTQNTEHEKKLMEKFSSDDLAIFPVVDEIARVNGLVVLLNVAKKEGILPDDVKILEILLSMLGGHVRIRVFQNKLFFVQNSLESILNNTGIDIYVNDFHSHEILYVNESMAAPYGGRSEFIGKKCWTVLFPEQNGPCEFCPQKQIVDENGDPSKVYTWDYQRAFDGLWFRVFSAAFRWSDGRLAHVVSSADITDNKKNEELIQYMANYDPLTNLPNRRMLISECENQIANVAENENRYVLFFDIDGFKAINDNYGHDAGDEFLVKLGEFFASIPMLKNAVYRNGGDEFVAIVGGTLIMKETIKNLTGFIHARFKKPWKLKKGDVFCNTSVGVGCYPEDGTTPEQLLHVADQAMYKAKKMGGGTMLFGYQI